MNKWLVRLLLLLILLVAAGLRLTGLDWDGYEHYHPDERFITWVATTIERPFSFATALNPTESTINPFYWPPDAESAGIVVPQDEHRDFAYGHVPLYLGVIATRLAESFAPMAQLLPESWLFTQDILNARQMVEFRHLTAVSRALTALFDVGAVLLVFLLGRRVYDEKVGLLAAAFLALNVMHIQLAHFFTSDPYLTFFIVGAIFFMVRVVTKDEGRGMKDEFFFNSPLANLLITAVFVGLAVGSKFSAVLLFLPLLVTVYFGFDRWQRMLVLSGLVALVTFAITNPFALLDFSCEAITPAMNLGPIHLPALDWRSCYLDNIGTQRTMVGGSVNIPFTLQYDGTIPYWYYIETQLRWGMGFLLGFVAFVGFGWAVWQEVRGLGVRDQGLGITTPSRITYHVSRFTFFIPHLSSFILLAWTVPFFLVTGAFYVKFMRYLQPLTPFLMIYGAAFLLSLKWKWVRWGSITAVLLLTSLYALAFVQLYNQPHPWITASEWVFANVKPGSLILSEQWDDSLPSTMMIDGEIRYRVEYPNKELVWLTYPDSRDDLAKLEANLQLLAEADYLTLMTNRGYSTVGRLPNRYPLSSQYYPLLFDGSLGYEPVFVVGRSPNLAGIHLYSDTFAKAGLVVPEMVQEWDTAVPHINLGPADESFLVYDQPLTIIFENVERKSADEMRTLFETN